MHGANGGTSTGGEQARTPGIVSCGFALLTLVAAPGLGADDAPLTATDPPRFQAGDISIGEPVALPFERPTATAPQPSTPTAPQHAAQTPGVRQPAAAAAVPGNGWLGLVVAESATPGRFAVAEVAAGGPAAAGGILAGDEVRAIDGLPLRNSDEVSQALTAIAPGQKVRLAIGRGEQVADVTLEAITRPPVARGWAAAGSVPAPRAIGSVPAPSAIPAPVAAPVAETRPAIAVTVPSPLPAASTPAVPLETTPSVGDARGRTALGVRTMPINPDVQARFRLPEASGAYVIGVVGDLPASKAGVPPGSVIVSLDNRPVRSPAELTELVTNGPVGRPMSLEYVLPGGTARRAEVVLQTLERPLEQALVGGVEPVATEVPALQPQPSAATVRRPVSALDQPTAKAVRDEIRQLRIRLESLERQLEAAVR